MSKSKSRYSALEEAPYLSMSRIIDDPLEKEIYDYDTLKGLHEISSDLIKNNPSAAAFALAYVNSLMGGKISFNVMGPDYIAKNLELMMVENLKHLDINFQYDLEMIMEYIVYMAFKKGDVLINAPYDKERGEIGTIIELIDAGRISTPADLQNNSLVRNGVKYSAGGRIEGYYVEPIDSLFANRRLLAIDYNFIPLFTRGKFGLVRQNCMMFKSPLFDEFGAGRAIPALIPSSKILRHMHDYVEYVVIGTKVAACYAGFITTKNAAGAKKQFDSTSNKLKHVGRLSPGGIYFLRKGEEITFGSPSRPADNMDASIKRMAIMSAASIRLPYELGFLHLENTSFSSWKGGHNEVTANKNRWVNRLETTAQFIAGSIYQEMILKRMVKDGNVKFVFNFPNFDPLDAEKTARANKIDKENGAISLHKIRADRNEDYDQIEMELLQEGMDEIERQAKLIAFKKDKEAEFGIIFPEDSPSRTEQELENLEVSSESTNSGKGDSGESNNLSDKNKQERNTSGSRRKGESKRGKLKEDDKLERRKEDGNI